MCSLIILYYRGSISNHLYMRTKFVTFKGCTSSALLFEHISNTGFVYHLYMFTAVPYKTSEIKISSSAGLCLS